MTDAVAAILEAHRACGGPTLLVDIDRELGVAFAKESNVVALSKTGKKPEEMWALAGAESMNLIVISAPRTERELYRMLALAERLIAPGGKILAPTTDDSSSVVQTFCNVYPNWTCISDEEIHLRKDAVSTPLRRVVAISIFGPDGETGYWKWLPTYVRAHHGLFPGYELRIHHDDAIYRSSYGDVLHGLQRRGLVKLVRMAADGLAIGQCKAMLWRLAAAWDPEVSHVFCRDVDSLPTWRDRMCCEEFIASGLAVGVIHDDPQHVYMMGGLCHFDTKKFIKAIGYKTFAEFVDGSNLDDDKWHEHGADQAYLNEIVAATMPGVLEHSLFTAQMEGGQRAHRDGPTLPNAEFRTEIAAPSQEVVDGVSEKVRIESGGFINYIGAAGFRLDEAMSFYNEQHVSPTTADIQEAERFAGFSK